MDATNCTVDTRLVSKLLFSSTPGSSASYSLSRRLHASARVIFCLGISLTCEDE